MASCQMYAALRRATLGSKNLTTSEPFSIAIQKYYLVNTSPLRHISTCLYQCDKSRSEDDVNSDDVRHDLSRLKQLLTMNKSTIVPEKKQKEVVKTTESPTVNIKEFKNILSSLSPRSRKQEKLSVPKVVTRKKVVRKVEKQEKVKDGVRQADVLKMKNILSSLNQDVSPNPAEDVMLAGRLQQLSPETTSEMEGVVNIKQRQIRDEQSKKQIPRNSLRSGPRLHWFDNVKSDWAREMPSKPSLFQAMAMKEVDNMGLSATVQSGFHELIENINLQWSFPIDNEICKKEEENVSFSDHVFLEHFLHEFPKSGNLRQFMELVITGLQQNPHLTVEEKKEHIMWFKDYFENVPDEAIQI